MGKYLEIINRWGTQKKIQKQSGGTLGKGQTAIECN